MKRNCVLMVASVASMIGQFNMQNIRLLTEMGYEVHVACNFQAGNTCDGKQIQRLKKQLHRLHVVSHQWDCPRNAYAVHKCLRAYLQLWKITGQYHFLWMHCHSPVGGVLGRLAAHRRGVKVIYTAHGFHFYQGAPFKNWLLFYPAEKMLSYWTDVLITINQEDYQFARNRLNAEKVCYIPGIGIDVSKFQYAGKQAADLEHRKFCKKWNIPENAVILLSVGELSRRKNHQAVISALAKMKNADIYYLICGQGKLKARLEKQAKALGIAKRVRILGYQADIMHFYQNADIFILPSRQEGLSVALMEAMAAGNACIVSDIRGNRDLIDDAGGIKFSLHETQTLFEALETLAKDRILRQTCGRYNQQKIKKYDQKTVNCRMEKIYVFFDTKCQQQAYTENRMKSR